MSNADNTASKEEMEALKSEVGKGQGAQAASTRELHAQLSEVSRVMHQLSEKMLSRGAADAQEKKPGGEDEGAASAAGSGGASRRSRQDAP